MRNKQGAAAGLEWANVPNLEPERARQQYVRTYVSEASCDGIWDKLRTAPYLGQWNTRITFISAMGPNTAAWPYPHVLA